jgi:hypothetical protein
MAPKDSQVNPAWALTVILLVGFVLRAAGISFGLPHLYHADEPIVVNHALAYGSGDLNPHFFKIPPLLSYLLFFAYGVSYLFGRAFGIFQGVWDFEALFYTDPSFFYLLGRLLFGAAAGTFSLYLFYRLIHKHFGQARALLGAFLLSVCFLHVRVSHYLYPDIPLIVLMLGAFFPILGVTESKGVKAHLWAGVSIGAAAAMKYNGAALFIPYFAATCMGPKQNLLVKWGVALFSAATVFALLNPYSILDFSAFLREVSAQAEAHTGAGWLHHFRTSLMGGLTPFLLILCLSGLVRLGFRSAPPKKAVLAVFVLGYYAVLVFAAQPYDRYVLPLLPFLIFFAADFLAEFAAIGAKTSFLGVLIAAAVVPNLIKSAQFDRIMAAPDLRTHAKDWIEKNIPDQSAIAMEIEFYMPRLRFAEDQLDKMTAGLAPGSSQLRKVDFLNKQPGPRYFLFGLADEPQDRSSFLLEKPKLPYDLQALRTAGVDYVITARLWKKDKHDAFYQALRESSELVARFNPYQGGQPEYALEHPLTGGPFLWEDLRRRLKNGQPLEIYRLKPFF